MLNPRRACEIDRNHDTKSDRIRCMRHDYRLRELAPPVYGSARERKKDRPAFGVDLVQLHAIVMGRREMAFFVGQVAWPLPHRRIESSHEVPLLIKLTIGFHLIGQNVHCQSPT